MIEQLSQLSKTIPLTSPLHINTHTHIYHSPQFSTILTHNRPSQLLTLLSSTQQYITQSNLFFNANYQKQKEGGIFQGFSFGLILQENGHHQYHQLKKQYQNNHKKDNHQPGLKIQQIITAENYGKYIKQYINGKQVQFVHTNVNNNVQFDKIVLKLFMMLRYDNCFHVNPNKNKLYIKWEQQLCKSDNPNNIQQKHARHQKQVFLQKYNNNYLEIQLVHTSDYDYRANYKSLHKKHIQYIKTQQYLTRVQKQLSFINNNKDINKNESKNLNPVPVSVDTNTQINQKLLFLTQQNKSLKEQLKQLRQQIKQQGAQILKNSQCVNNILRQIQGIQKYIYTHGQKLQIQQNKLMKVFDDIQEIRKQIGTNKLGNKSGLSVIGHQAVQHKDNKHAPSFVPDHLRQKLLIDLHSNYLSKFQISGSQITYIGQDKQATQLLSSRVYGLTQKHKHLKNTLKILKTRSKCIKFGIIDRKYSKQRSCWNSTNIIYLHGWGHTMSSTSEQDHKNCDYGTGNIVEMQANFQEGWIKWAIDHSSRGIKLSGDKQRKLLRNGEIQWVPFIAMYDYLDAVQWKIGQQ